MSKNSRVYTFIIAPAGSSKVRQISIHQKVLHIGAIVSAVLISVVVYGAVRVAQTEALGIRNFTLKSENTKLKQQNEAYENSYSKLKGQISYIEDMSREFARQAKLERSPEIDEQAGIGGPETVTALDKSADRLEREMRHINDRLRSDMLRLASMPAGLPVNGY